MSSKGTPKTLREAIQNALDDPNAVDEEKAQIRPEVIEQHVRDYLAQKFSVAFISDQSPQELWEAITGQKSRHVVERFRFRDGTVHFQVINQESGEIAMFFNAAVLGESKANAAAIEYARKLNSGEIGGAA